MACKLANISLAQTQTSEDVPIKNGVSSSDSMVAKKNMASAVQEALFSQGEAAAQAAAQTSKSKDDVKAEPVLKVQTETKTGSKSTTKAEAKKEIVTVLNPGDIPAKPSMFFSGQPGGDSAERTKPEQTPRPPRMTPDANAVSQESDKFRKQRPSDENISGTGGSGLANADNGFKSCEEHQKANTGAQTEAEGQDQIRTNIAICP